MEHDVEHDVEQPIDRISLGTDSSELRRLLVTSAEFRRLHLVEQLVEHLTVQPVVEQDTEHPMDLVSAVSDADFTLLSLATVAASLSPTAILPSLLYDWLAIWNANCSALAENAVIPRTATSFNSVFITSPLAMRQPDWSNIKKRLSVCRARIGF